MGTRTKPSARPFLGHSVVGQLLVATGAVASAFGAVGWLSALRAPSFLGFVVGVLGYGVLPLFFGLWLVWRGLDKLDEDALAEKNGFVIRAALLDAVQGGATAQEVAQKLALPSLKEAERELDGLVIDELAQLELTDDGDLVYRSTAELPSARQR